MTKDGVWEVGGFELKLTNLDKVIFPPRDDGEPVMKRDLIRYFALIAPTMLPHLQERPLNFQRFPNGPNAPGLLAEGHPRHGAGVAAALEGGRRRGARGQRAPRSPTGSARCAGSATRRRSRSTPGRPESTTRWRPTFALIDIDPGTKTTWDETVTLAKLYRTALGHLGVRGYPKTTGKRGIQVWIPIEPKYSFRETSDWVEKLSRAVGSTVPDLVSWEWAKASRGGKARLDYTQNTYIKTLVAPYAVRPADGAPVSTPIAWDELDDPDLRSDRWTIRTIIDRVREGGRPLRRRPDRRPGPALALGDERYDLGHEAVDRAGDALGVARREG